MTNSTIKVTKNGSIATVTLDNPDKHNAFDDAIIEAMTVAFSEIQSDDSVRVMVLRANGKNFSAGGDLEWMKRMATYSEEENLIDARKLANMLKTLNGLSKPTIARVQGAAFGGAVGLVSCCDIAVATSKASFSLSEVKIGLLPATIAPYVINAIGSRAARRYFITAERFSAEAAHQLGLVSEICEEEELDNEVSRFIAALLKNSPAAVNAAKVLVSDLSNETIDDQLIEDTCQRIASIRASIEGQEGLTAFLEKRAPSWVTPNKSH
ncbi:MAG: methylglutaconyl-CoA hydratase [Cryomorphaceae bacterium]|jgi:methylglutaconyl-CoA hydratase